MAIAHMKYSWSKLKCDAGVKHMLNFSDLEKMKMSQLSHNNYMWNDNIWAMLC